MKKQITKKLTLKKSTVSNLEMGKITGGKHTDELTCDYSQCGTGVYTLVPCLCD